MRKIYGDRLDPGSVGPRKVVGVPASKAASPPVQVDRWARNGLHPDAQFNNQLREATNAAVLFRTKEVYAAHGRIGVTGVIASFGAGDRHRWRFAFKTSNYMHGLLAKVVMHPPNGTGATYNSLGRLKIFSDATETTTVATVDFVYGDSPTGVTDANGRQYLKEIVLDVTGLSQDTQYYARFTDVDYGRIQSATVFEMASMTENTSGYLAQSYTTGASILDIDREQVTTIQNLIWKRVGSRCFTWSMDDQSTPRTRTSGTPINAIDNSSTAVGASAPGYKLQMQYKNRLSQSTGVPVAMWAFGSATVGGGAGNAGRVYLVNSGGSNVLTINQPWVTGAAAQWYSIAGVLPATQDTYYLHFDVGTTVGPTFSLFAVSLYELD